MKTLRAAEIKELPKYDPIQQLQDLVTSGIERYDRIRSGFIYIFSHYKLAPIQMYEMASILEGIAMGELQAVVIDFVAYKFDNSISYKKDIDFQIYDKTYTGASENIQNAWADALKVLSQEKVKSIELSRVAAELRTTAMEQFIQTVDNFIVTKLEENKNVTVGNLQSTEGELSKLDDHEGDNTSSEGVLKGLNTESADKDEMA